MIVANSWHWISCRFPSVTFLPVYSDKTCNWHSLWNCIGKGVPLQRRCTNNKASPVDENTIPTVQAAVQMFRGNLTAEQTFGRDPLNELWAKKHAREAEFKKHFPRFDLIFQAIANGNYALLRDAILYHINLTKYLSRQWSFIIFFLKIKRWNSWLL